MTTLPALTDIPEALRSRDQWVVWRSEPREKGGKPTKVPYQAYWPERKASSNAPRTWASVEKAIETAAKHGFDGIGYVFSPDDPFVGFDFDDVLADDGTLADWAIAWLQELTTYVEVSPSGHGVKGIAIGKLPGGGINAGCVELYDQGRYFAITGRRYDSFPEQPLPLNGQIDRLYAFAQQEKARYEADREQHRRESYALGALRSEVDKVRGAPSGTRNDALNRAAFALAQFMNEGLLTEDAIVDALASAAGDAGLGPAEIRGTLRSGIRAGSQETRAIPQSRPHVDTTTGEILDTPQAKPKLTNYVVDWRSQGVTLAQLQHKQFAAERWIVEDIFPEGACLLAAKYKSRKSWLALAISLAVSMGNKALGRLTVSPGRVLYLDLEGKQQRIQKRTRAMLGVAHVQWPDNFHIYTKWPQGDEGMQELEYWFKSYPDTGLVVVDVLASFRRPMERHEEVYRYDRDTIDPLNAMFEQHHAGGLLVHHFNKGKHDDIMDSITGSTGLPSAVNTMWGFTRDPNDSNITVMHLRGRDLENDDPLALRWDSYLNQHVIEGPANEVAISAERRAILGLLGDDEPRTPKEIAADLGRPVETIKQLLRKLLNDGLIDKPIYGKYARVPQRDHSDHSDHSGNSDHSSHSGNGITFKSDRDSPRVIGDDSTDHSVSAQQDAVNDKSDRSDRHIKGNSYWNAIPASLRMTTRMMLTSDVERNVEEARARCERYGLNYDEARRIALEDARNET